MVILAFGFSISVWAMLMFRASIFAGRPPFLPCAPRGSEPGLSPLADEFPFEFRQSAKHMEDQFASAGCRVHALAQALKADSAGGESI